MTSPTASPRPPLKTHERHPKQDTAYDGHIAVPLDDQVDYVHEAKLHRAHGTHVEESEGAPAKATTKPAPATPTPASPMPALTEAERRALPVDDFALPGKKYPVQDRAQAIDAKARARGALRAGRLNARDRARVDAKANAVLRSSR